MKKHRIRRHEEIPRENGPQQIIVIPMNIVKRLQKGGIKWLTKQTFVSCINYEQHVGNVNL
jgi:hypothetical protein